MRERAIARVLLLAVTWLGWAALATAIMLVVPAPLLLTVPLVVLLAAFEVNLGTVRAAERVANYLRVVFEERRGVSGWETASADLAGQYPSSVGDPLFIWVFVAVLCANYLCVVIALPETADPTARAREDSLDLALVTALHLTLVLRFVLARRALQARPDARARAAARSDRVRNWGRPVTEVTGAALWRGRRSGRNRLSFRAVLRRSCSVLPTLGRGLEYAQTTKCMDWMSAPREVASKCFADYRLSATMPMTLTVSIPQRLPTVRTRTTNWIAVFAAALMCMGGWVADADAAPRSRTRASSARKGTAVKARPKVSKARKRATRTRISSVRRSRLARARARHTQWLEAQQPRYKTDASGALVPDVRAAAAIIYNPETGQVLWEANSLDKRSIASITKVMTAAVVLEDDPDLSGWSSSIGATPTRPTTRISAPRIASRIGDLLHLTLIASDNAAARALARSSPEGSAAFIDRMNAKAQEIGSRQHYVPRSVRARRLEHVVSLRYGSSDRLRCG